MKAPTPRHLRKYVAGCLRLKWYLQEPGDGRVQPQIPAGILLWSLLVGQILRECSFAAVEALACSSARPALGFSRTFGDDALSYFVERADPNVTRTAAVDVIRRAKRNKAFDDSRFIGLALDGTRAGGSQEKICPLCRPTKNKKEEIVGYHHELVMISVVGTGLSLPFDVEPYGPGDSEYAAGQRLLRRALGHCGPRFADYLVVDSKFATAPFLKTAGKLKLPVVARLKDNLPELFTAAQKRFGAEPPHAVFRYGQDRVEIWDADDFDPWDTLDWETVRVVRYRQHKPDGQIIDAYWLTNFLQRRVGSREIFRIGKSRWEIENQGFNDGKNRHHMEHICHHEANSLVVVWLIMALALTIERLYRLRYLHRGNHPVLTAIALVRLLRL
ncbi:MAG: transposase, partial [Chloroflexota bacterium]